MAIDDRLREYATDRQWEIYTVREGCQTTEEASKILNISQRNVCAAIDRLKIAAARAGYSPSHDMVRPVPEGFHLRGTSTLYDGDGKQRLQWVKSNIDHNRQAELFREAAEAMAEELPKISPSKSCGPYNSNLLAVYPIGDAHIGMRSWAEETGHDFDLSIAEARQCAAMAELVSRAPDCQKAVILNLGDWLHYDNINAVTTRSGNVLDVDGRYAKVVRVGVKVMRQCITSALEKHKEVHVINVIGNHDDTGAIWLSVALDHTYENEPRVTIETSPAPFMYYRFGRVFIMTTHGHNCKIDKLPGVMATDRPEDWGETKFRYIYTGHIHHQQVNEFPGVTHESFNTLAGNDAYAAHGGWRSRQNMKCIVHHKDFGEVARHTVNPAMLDRTYRYDS